MAESARDEGQTPPAGWRQLTAINTAKMLTVVLLLVLAAVVGVQDMRQVVYLTGLSKSVIKARLGQPTLRPAPASP